MMWGYDGFGGGWMMGAGMLLFWGLIIFGIVLLVREFGGMRRGRDGDLMPRERTAVDILRERYARGEIDRREFEEKLGDLERRGTPAP